ncbi:hypothetical protein Tco_0942704 [Tanacetum coccineum]
MALPSSLSIGSNSSPLIRYGSYGLPTSAIQAFTRAPTQYKEYVSEFWYTARTLPDSKTWVSTPTGEVRGEIGITTFRNALRAQYLPHSSMYVSPLPITTVRPWFATIGYNGEIGDLIHKLNKKTREKIVSYPRFISLLLDHMTPEYDKEELTINPTQVSQGKKSGAKSGLRRKQSSKHTSESTTEVSKSQSGQSKKETQSSSAKDKSPSHHSPPTPVVGEMHKEAQQAAGGLTSLGAISEEGAHLQLGSEHDASADSTSEADPGISALKDSISSKQGMDEGTKNYSFDHIFARYNPSVLVDKTKSAGDGLKTAHTDSGTNEESKVDDISLKERWRTARLSQ